MDNRRDYYQVLGVPATRTPRPSRARSAGSPGAITRTPAPSWALSSGSGRLPRPAGCCPTRPSGPATMPADSSAWPGPPRRTPFDKGMSTGLLVGVTVQFGGGYRVPAAAYPYRCGRPRAQIGDPVDAGHPASASADEQCPVPAAPVGHRRTPRLACLTAGGLEHQHRSPDDQGEPAGTEVAQRSRFDPVRDPPQWPVPIRPAVPRPLPRHDSHVEVGDTGSLRRLTRAVLAPAPGSFVRRQSAARSRRSRGNAGPARRRYGRVRRR